MKRTWLILLFFLVIKLILQVYAIDPVYELHRDEYLHLDLGKHLDWGYLTVPPLTGLISKVILLLGGAVFWIKLFPAITGMLMMIIVWETVKTLKGGVLAGILALSGMTFSALVRMNILYQPNSADYLFWTLFYFLLIKIIQSEHPKWIYLAAVGFAIGFLNKYNICFLVAGLLPAILFSQHRRIFATRHFYLAAGVAFLLVLPNLVWQGMNGFPVWHHLQELSGTQLVNVNRFNFLMEQLYFFPASLPVMGMALFAFFLYPPFRRFRVLFWGFLFTLLIFILLRAKNYYAVGLYPLLIAFGSVYMENLMSAGWRKWVLIAAILLPPVLIIPLYPIMNPVMTPEEVVRDKKTYDDLGLTRWEDGKIHDVPQDYADMQGWKELAHLVDSAFQLSGDKVSTIVHCDNYGQAGAVNYYSKVPGVKAYSMNADYINWYPLDQGEITNAILVKDIWDVDASREREKAFFEEVRYIGEIKNRFAREKGTRVFLLRNARVPINEILRQEIKENRNNV